MLPLLKVDFNPVSEFTDFVHNPYVSLPLGLDINKAVIYLWMAARARDPRDARWSCAAA